MDIKDFESLRKKIDNANAKRERAIGALEQVKGKLKSDYGIENIEEGHAKLEGMDKRIAREKEKYASLMDELNGMADWDNL